MPEPVLITGAGPTGLTAALELSRFGIPVRIIDKRAKPADTSRAIGVQARTLELFARRGLADELIKIGNPARGGAIYGGGEVLFRIDMTTIDSPFPMLLFVSQVETERVLRAAIARHGVTIEWGVELVGFTQDAHSTHPRPVGAVLRHTDGRLEPTEAAYLISAEGAHSVIRNTLGLEFEGHTRVEHYSLGDVHMEGDLPADEFQIFSSDHGFMAVFPLAPGHVRLIISDPPGDPSRGTPPTLEELQAVYDQRSPIPARLHDVVWSSWFRINSRMVAQLKVGRCLFGGDSAHIHSPAGAQGMNTGIQDMINLGWKLALVLKGQAQPSLLDTYADDRLPVMRSVLNQTDRLTSMIGSENPIVRGLVNHLAPWVGGSALVQANAPAGMSQIALGYRASVLSKQWATGGSLHAGDRVPDLAVQLRDGDSWRATTVHPYLDPSRFLLLITAPGSDPDADAELRAAIAPWRDLITALEVAPPTEEATAASFRAAFGPNPGAFLVRPDGYLGFTATGTHTAHHLTNYCQDWLGEQPTS